LTLFRFTASGVLDSSFDGDGIVSTNVNQGEPIFALLTGASDRIYVAWKSILVAFDSAGARDNSFGTVTIPPISAAASATKDASGSLVFVGGSGNQMTLTRVNDAGTVVAQNSIGGGEARSVTCANDGACFVGGQSAFGASGLPILAKTTNAGILDATFGNDGVALPDVDRATQFKVEGRLTSLAVQPDGKVLAFGSFEANDDFQNGFAAVVRFNASGTLDNTFDGGQLLAVDRDAFPFSGPTQNRLALLTNGKILGALQSNFGTSSVGVGLFRLAGGLLPGPMFHPLPPARILDTRLGVGGPATRFASGETRSLKVTGVGGVPAVGVGAVVLNVTVTQPNEFAYLTIFPSDELLPNSSNLNYASNDTIANLVIAKIGSDGNVSIFSAGTPHVIADIEGYFDDGTPATGDRYHPLNPERVLDTRLGIGAPQRLGPDASLRLQVAGRGAVPPTGATAVVLNVTAAAPTDSSYLTVWPTDQARPTASNLNFVANKTIPNLVIVKLGPTGAVDIYNELGGVEVLADVVGWFGPQPSETRFYPLAPERVLDTRGSLPGGGFQAGETRSLDLDGFGGIPSTGACAAVLNVTATEATGPSYLTLWPSGEALPAASNLNFRTGPAIANLVVVRLGEQGRINIYNERGYVNVIVDVAGWFSC
jgi:uncharacterized delta-60 repeat protein